MPNWCANEITITGPLKDVEALLDQANQTHRHYVPNYSSLPAQPDGEWKEVPGMLWAFIPPPEEIRTEDRYFAVKDDGMEDKGEWWYNWNHSYWNTKWDVTDGSVDLLDDTPNDAVARIGFDSAWSPPTPVAIAMSEQYPTLEISHEYWEEGAGFQGELIVRNGGEVIQEVEGPTDHAWWSGKFGGCREVEWETIDEGEACYECGEVRPMSPEFIFFGGEK